MPHTLSPQQAEALAALRALTANLTVDQMTLVQRYIGTLARLTPNETAYLATVVETSKDAIPHKSVA
jgi:hypothetical protein